MTVPFDVAEAAPLDSTYLQVVEAGESRSQPIVQRQPDAQEPDAQEPDAQDIDAQDIDAQAADPRDFDPNDFEPQDAEAQEIVAQAVEALRADRAVCDRCLSMVLTAIGTALMASREQRQDGVLYWLDRAAGNLAGYAEACARMGCELDAQKLRTPLALVGNLVDDPEVAQAWFGQMTDGLLFRLAFSVIGFAAKGWPEAVPLVLAVEAAVLAKPTAPAPLRDLITRARAAR